MLKNIIQSLLTRGTVAAINFLVLVISSRYLGVSSRGEISIFILNVSIIQGINEVYTGYSLIHFIPRFSLKRMVMDGLVFTFIFTSLSNAIIVFLGKQVQGYEWLGYLVSLLVILNTFQCIILLGKQDIRMFNILSILQPLLLFFGIAVSIFVFRVYTFEAYIFPLLVSFAAAFLVSGFTVLRYLFKKHESKPYHLPQILGSGLAYQAGLLMFIFSNRLSYYILPGKASVGLYSSAATLTESVLVIANGIAPVLLSKVANQNSNRQNVEISISLGKLVFFLSSLATLLLLSVPEQFFVLILGKGFTGIKVLMLQYAPAVMAMSAIIPLAAYFSASGRQKIILFAYGFSFLVTVLSAPKLIHYYDALGAAYAANLAYPLMAFFLFGAFVSINKVSLLRCFSFKEDYENLKRLFGISGN